MTNTVNIPTNMLPEDGRFGSGPSKIRPEQVQALDAGARNLLGTSHRQTPVKQVVGSIREGLSNFFQIPDGYEVVLGNGGASAFWDIACASLITRKAAFGTYGSFSAKFAKSAQSAPFLRIRRSSRANRARIACRSSPNMWTLTAGRTTKRPLAWRPRSSVSKVPRSRAR